MNLAGLSADDLARLREEHERGLAAARQSASPPSAAGA
jgi:hypothetical protein